MGMNGSGGPVGKAPRPVCERQRFESHLVPIFLSYIVQVLRRKTYTELVSIVLMESQIRKGKLHFLNTFLFYVIHFELFCNSEF